MYLEVVKGLSPRLMSSTLPQLGWSQTKGVIVSVKSLRAKFVNPCTHCPAMHTTFALSWATIDVLRIEIRTKTNVIITEREKKGEEGDWRALTLCHVHFQWHLENNNWPLRGIRPGSTIYGREQRTKYDPQMEVAKVAMYGSRSPSSNPAIVSHGRQMAEMAESRT